MEFLVWIVFGAVALLVDVLANKQKRQRQRERAQQSQQQSQQTESSQGSFGTAYGDEDDFSFEEYQAEMERQWREEQARKQLGDLASEHIPERAVVWEDVSADVPWESSTGGEPRKETPYVAVPTVDGGVMIPVPPILQEPPVEERHTPVSVSIQPTAMPTAVSRVGTGHKPVTEWAQRTRRRGRISRSEARTAVVWMEILGKPKGLA